MEQALKQERDRSKDHVCYEVDEESLIILADALQGLARFLESGRCCPDIRLMHWGDGATTASNAAMRLRQVVARRKAKAIGT